MKFTRNAQKVTLLAGALLLSSRTVRAADEVIPYQGRLEQDGAPVTGRYDFRFGLFKAEVNEPACLTTLPAANCSGGDYLWSEQIDGVAVDAGTFTVRLGETEALSLPTLGSGDLWLAIAVRSAATGGAFASMAQSQHIVPTPLAAAGTDFRASRNVTVDGQVQAEELVGIGAVPVGGIVLWDLRVAPRPANFAICDGLTNYAAGPNGKVPNLLGRFPIGMGAGTLASQASPTGGADTHTHQFTTGNQGGTTSGGNDRDQGITHACPNAEKRDAPKEDHTHPTGHTHTKTSNTASNLPDHYKLVYLIRIQ